ncbi:MAG: oligosaccharide flippase family protein [Bacteroides sp.]|nr:oligosaccharide flippase family protein [Bacteroides sp.]
MEKKNISAPVKASIWFAVCNIVRKLIVYISMPLFTRIMDTEQYGIYTMYCSWSEIIFLFTTLSISTNVYNKCVIKYKEKIWEFTSSILVLTTLISVFVCGLIYNNFSFISNMIQIPKEVVLFILVDSVFMPAFNYWAITQRYEYKYKGIVALSMFQTILNPIVGVILVLNLNGSGAARCLSIVIANCIVNIPVYVWILIKGKCAINFKYWKYALYSTIPLLPHYLSQILLNQMDRIMVGNICGSSYAAIYGVAYSVSIASLIVNRAINDTYAPWLYQRIEEGKLERVPKITNGLVLLIAVMDYIVILIGPEIISILGSKEYKVAIWIIPPVAISGFLLFIYSLFCNVEFYFEVQKYMTVVSVVIALINYITNKIFILQYGFIAAGYTTLLCYVLFALFHFIIMKRTLRKQNMESVYDEKIIIMITVTLLIVGMVTSVLYIYTYVRYTLMIFLLFITCIKYKDILDFVKKIVRKEL